MLLLLFVLALVNYVIFAADQSPSFANRPARLWYTDFFITSYTVKQRDAWMGTTVAGLVLVALGLVVYRQVWVGWYKFDDRDYSLSESEDLHSAAADRVVRYTAEGVIDVSSHYRSKAELVGRRLGSVLVFVGFVAVQVVTSIAITRSGQGTDSVGGAFAIAFIAAALNIAFTMVSRKLTEFEKYETLGAVDRSLVIKLVGFKIANIMAVYGAKRYDAARCVYDVIGEQFMTQLLVEIFFVTPSTVAAAALFTANKQYVASATKSILGDDKHCARFELPVEYLAALYKFLLAAMAMTVFPLSTLLSLAAFFVEFWAARYRLVKLCGKPVRSDASHRTVVVFTMFVIFVAAITTPFAGAAFVLSGNSMLQTNTTRLCNGFPTT